ncbi:hypothetical protein V1477_017265, partial [Vespula maculifrons]
YLENRSTRRKTMNRFKNSMQKFAGSELSALGSDLADQADDSCMRSMLQRATPYVRYARSHLGHFADLRNFKTRILLFRKIFQRSNTSNEIHMILDKSSIRLKTIQNVIAQKWPVSGQAWSLVGRYADTTFALTTTES